MILYNNIGYIDVLKDRLYHQLGQIRGLKKPSFVPYDHFWEFIIVWSGNSGT